MKKLNRFNLMIFLVLVSLSIQVLAQQTPCKTSKKHQFILENSQLFKNVYVSKVEPFSASQVYVKNMRNGDKLKYRICDLKIENDSLIIEGFLKNTRNSLYENMFFLVGTKSDTVYTENLSSLGIQLFAGPYEAFYLKNLKFQFIETSHLELIPKKIHFKYKFSIQNNSLFVISVNNFFTEIFDIKSIKENLEF